MSFSEFLYSFLLYPYECQIYPNAKEFYDTHYDAMELLEIVEWKMEIEQLFFKLIFVV